MFSSIYLCFEKGEKSANNVKLLENVICSSPTLKTKRRLRRWGGEILARSESLPDPDSVAQFSRGLLEGQKEQIPEHMIHGARLGLCQASIIRDF